jgi:predicted DsbA family dithiol-disulfide isomerase
MCAVLAASPADLDNLAPLPAEGVRQVLHWYDFACPFCYVGQQRNTILERLGFDVIELPFQGHPDTPAEGRAIGRRSSPMVAFIEQEARSAGLSLNWPRHMPNTRMALAAAEWTRRHAPSSFRALQKALYTAHFVLGEDLGDAELIDRYAKSCGVDLTALHAALADGSAEHAVAQAEALGHEHGVQGTPAWLLPQGLINGLRPAAEFERLARDVAIKEVGVT